MIRKDSIRNSPQGDYDELSVLGPLLDVVGDYGDILEVQCGVDLVHHVERGGLVVVEGEDQGERGESLLPTGEVGNVLTVNTIPSAKGGGTRCCG